MKILVVVQARMASTRLPNKVLLPVMGVPLLEAMINRVRAARTQFELVVATTWDESDDSIVSLCEHIRVHCFRGHPTDLLQRHYLAGLKHGAEAIVKIPSDCPLIDPAIIDDVLSFFIGHERDYDYVSNLHPATYPDGNDVEVAHTEVFERAFYNARRPFEREHATPYIWERPELFRIGNVPWQRALNYSMSHRFTIDYAEDYHFIRRVFEELGGPARVFGLSEILELLEQKPEIAKINARYAGVNWYRHHLSELSQIGVEHTRYLENER